MVVFIVPGGSRSISRDSASGRWGEVEGCQMVGLREQHVAGMTSEVLGIQ